MAKSHYFVLIAFVLFSLNQAHLDEEFEHHFRLSQVATNARSQALTRSDALCTNEDYPYVVFAEDYSKHHLPIADDKEPVTVNFSINLSSILEINEPKQVELQ